MGHFEYMGMHLTISILRLLLAQKFTGTVYTPKNSRCAMWGGVKHLFTVIKPIAQPSASREKTVEGVNGQSTSTTIGT